MKTNKIISLLLTASTLSLAGCHSFSTNPLGLKVAAPAGSPAIALFAHIGEDSVEINAAENVQGYMTDAADKDMVILPTNYGINAIVNKKVGFKIAATVTFGNFYLLSTGLDDNSELTAGDKVLAFQQNGVAGKLLNYVYGDRNLDITYLADAKSVKDAILTSQDFDYDYVLLAQPVVKVILEKKSSYSIFADLQSDYKIKTNGKEITQASIFVKNSADVELVQKALETIKSDINHMISNPQDLISQTSSLEQEKVSAKFTTTAETVKYLIENGNQLGVGYKDALSNKANIDSFLNALGMGETNEEIYFHFEK